MAKRKFIFGSYDTAAKGWTLGRWTLSPAVEKTNFIDKPGGDGSWDLSTALTDGISKFKDRTLTVPLETSEGDRLSREALIDTMINNLEGKRVNITFPDDNGHYMTGRLHVVKNYNDLAHAAVTVTATCDPWKYSNTEQIKTFTATTTKKTATIPNNGRRAVVPVLKVEGSGASVNLEFGNASTGLSAGTHKWPAMLLTTGPHTLTYYGSGTLTVTYREAVL